jgi:hypothetical protein
MTNPGEVKGVPPAAKPVAWNVSYNNGEPFTVVATSEREVVAEVLKRLGMETPVHPLRVWPKKQEQS